MQKFCKSEALSNSWPEINVNVIKTAHRRSNFLKSLISQEIFANIGLRKMEYVIYIFAYNFASFGMKLETVTIL